MSVMVSAGYTALTKRNHKAEGIAKNTSHQLSGSASPGFGSPAYMESPKYVVQPVCRTLLAALLLVHEPAAEKIS